MFYLRYFCLFAYSGVQHILCCVLSLFVFVLCSVYPVSLDCPFLIAPSVSLDYPFLIAPLVSLDCPLLIAPSVSLTFIYSNIYCDLVFVIIIIIIVIIIMQYRYLTCVSLKYYLKKKTNLFSKTLLHFKFANDPVSGPQCRFYNVYLPIKIVVFNSISPR